MKQIFGRSNGSSQSPSRACAYFSAGMASPVSVDWLMNRSLLRAGGVRPELCPCGKSDDISGTSCSIGFQKTDCPHHMGASDARRVCTMARSLAALVGFVLLYKGGCNRKDHHRAMTTAAGRPRKIRNGRQGEQQGVQRITGAAP